MYIYICMYMCVCVCVCVYLCVCMYELVVCVKKEKFSLVNFTTNWFFQKPVICFVCDKYEFLH